MHIVGLDLMVDGGKATIDNSERSFLSTTSPMMEFSLFFLFFPLLCVTLNLESHLLLFSIFDEIVGGAGRVGMWGFRLVDRWLEADH